MNTLQQRRHVMGGRTSSVRILAFTLLAPALILAGCGPAASPPSTARPAVLNTSKPVASATPVKTATATATATPALGIGSVSIRPADGMSMLYVPQGEFTMGSDTGSPDERPAHTVLLDAYWMDQTEVTNAMYQSCVAAGACKAPLAKSSFHRSAYYGSPQFEAFPVITVNWDSAKAYCEWAGARLPTEAEWEKAARGTDERVFPWGEAATCSLANTNRCQGDTGEVGGYEQGKSPFGMYDMAGNVKEWTADWYDAEYYSDSPSSNPQGPVSGQYRAARGGSWYEFPDLAQTTSRSKLAPSDSLNYVGFRCVLPGPAGAAQPVTGSVAAPVTASTVTVTAAAFTPGSAAGVTSACEGPDLAYGQSVLNQPRGGEWIGGRWQVYYFCGSKDDDVEIRVSVDLLPGTVKQKRQCLNKSLVVIALRLEDPTGTQILAEADRLGVEASIGEYKLLSDGTYRIFISYGGNGIRCYGGTITLEKK